MKFFIIASDPVEAWDMQVVGSNAGNTFLFDDDSKARNALKTLL
jgi:hypothetical protein